MVEPNANEAVEPWGGIPVVLPDGRPALHIASVGDGPGAEVWRLVRTADRPSLHALGASLRGMGIAATVSQAGSLEDLAQVVEIGRPLLIAPNAGELWDDPRRSGFGDPNSLALVEGIYRDRDTGDLIGADLVDASAPVVAARFRPVDALRRGWLEPGGLMIAFDD